MTDRARWLALAAVSGLFAGMVRAQYLLALLSLAVLLWLLVEWLLFAISIRLQLSHLRLERTVNGRRMQSGILWAGRTVTVQLKAQFWPGRADQIVTLRDVIPENLKVASSANELWLTEPCPEAEFTYTAAVRAAGRVVLPGVFLVLQDRQGFFRAERFVRLPGVYRVLPTFAEIGDLRPTVKRVNALPQHGIHRLQRSGMGSELLELREYVVGDPPKSIAWKVSARRDRLMTRQYESEVPVRLKLFIDGSIGTRIGGYGQRLLDQMTYVAASVAKAAARVGDPVGAVLIDERGPQRLPAATGERGFLQLLSALADFSVNPTPPPVRMNSQLIEAGLSFVGERFPELLDSRVNQIPWTIFPLLPWKRRQFRERCLLAAAVAHLYQLPVSRHVQMIHDDGQLAFYLQNLLNRFGCAWMEPVIENRRRGDQDSLPRMQVLSDAIAGSVARARDNEIFVVLADLVDSVSGISHLVPAVRMALARHHRIVFVCPSPTFLRPTEESLKPRSVHVADLLLAAEQVRLRDLSQRLQRELGRLGAAVTMSGQQNAVHMVLSQMELIRSGRSKSASFGAAGRG